MVRVLVCYGDRVFGVLGVPHGNEFIAGLAELFQSISNSLNSLTILKDSPPSNFFVNVIEFIFGYYRRVDREKFPRNTSGMNGCETSQVRYPSFNFLF